MTFFEILRCEATNLPIVQKENTDFRTLLREILSRFEDVVLSSNDLARGTDGEKSFRSDIFKNRVRRACRGVLKTIDAYYMGKPSDAYEEFSNTMRVTNLKGYLNKGLVLKKQANLFRIRTMDGNFALRPYDLFHIPFEKRGIVKSQRYSIPGLPSLYLANSIYVAWEELGRPSYSTIQAVRLQAAREIRLLDMTHDVYTRNAHFIDPLHYGWQPLYKVITWPLIAACSFKVRNPADTFKPEYIVPQLLMQWINTSEVDGIMYSSTHVNQNADFGFFCNIVIPVQQHLTLSGHCPTVSSMFYSTDCLPMQLRQFAVPSERFYDQETISTSINPDIGTIELIKGKPQPYAYTSFGSLEHSLMHLDANPIS